MYEAFLTGKHLDEAAEVLDRDDSSLVHPVSLDLLGDRADLLFGLVGTLDVRAPDGDRAVVLDLDLGAGLLLDALDHLAARSDHEADLLRIDLDAHNLRSKRRDLLARTVERLEHLLEDVDAAFPGLVEGLGHDLGADTGDLDVHLQSGDSELRPGDLEVHVAVVILAAEDVAQYRDLVTLDDHSHGDAGNGLANLHSSVHQAERTATNRRHRRGSVRLHDVGDDTNGVGKVVLVRHDGRQRSLREVSVTDLASFRTAIRPRLTDTEGRKIVVKREAFLVLLTEAVDDLLIRAGAERDRNQRLRLATSEQRRTVDLTRQDPDLGGDRTDVTRAAAIRSRTAQNQLTLGFIRKLREQRRHEVPVERVRIGLLR